MRIKAFENSLVWGKAYNLALLIYKITQDFPKEERYGLTSQIRRCAISIPSNIAEGLLRNSCKELSRFFAISRGSCGELITQMSIAKDIGYTEEDVLNAVESKIIEIIKILTKSIQTLSTKT
ncbi:hypothetical protein COT83_02320 [Candidatus Peregrinibacteria bacterium CG10_big_fil_rev_8_21_14_0_10_44_7]|nr:MAG: hypothetical protein COT83_02320 [Candidatus Peregrinibacteria bacterium CG10_big_fil_rev_8_21_14_0_10_44_7]PJB88712.1 MAG: hypothetical protein CO082_03685 [Candidatus Peregrinibacteria bacterium CG_4_9_14_0_8_um_filter_44_15]